MFVPRKTQPESCEKLSLGRGQSLNKLRARKHIQERDTIRSFNVSYLLLSLMLEEICRNWPQNEGPTCFYQCEIARFGLIYWFFVGTSR